MKYVTVIGNVQVHSTERPAYASNQYVMFGTGAHVVVPTRDTRGVPDVKFVEWDEEDFISDAVISSHDVTVFDTHSNGRTLDLVRRTNPPRTR